MTSNLLTSVFPLRIILIFSCQGKTDDLPVPTAFYPLNAQHLTHDISPNKNQPGEPNGVHLAPGPFGHPQGSYQFSGSFGSYIEIPNNGGLDTRYSITILAWLNQENDDGPIVNFGSDVWGFHFWVVNGRLFARPSRRADRALAKYAVSSSLEPGTWNYVGTSYNFSSGVVKIWINGSEVAHEITGGEEQSTQYDVRVGAKASTTDRRYLKGRICCLQIYNKSLSQKEIIAVQNRTLNTYQRFFQPVFAVGEQLQSDVVKTSKASTVMECLLRCSRMTECKSASTEETSIGRSPAGYCQLYRRPFDETSRPASYFKLKQYYNELN
ncbi:uncharacterized protein [Porites lutea]|uniref:uncharacterized protein n=1 Tax=Porites lutea TaxID=51062 RepID=UPI003CC5ECC7